MKSGYRLTVCLAGVALLWLAWPASRSMGPVRMRGEAGRDLPAPANAATGRTQARVSPGERMVSSSGGPQIGPEELYERLQARSQVGWKVRRGASGAIVRVSEGSLASGVGGVPQAAALFLGEFGPLFTEARSSEFRLVQVQKDSELTQLIFEQYLNEVRVHPSRVSLLYDASGALRHGDFYLYSGSSETAEAARSSPAIPMGVAVAAARRILIAYLTRTGELTGPEAYPASSMESQGERILRLTGERISPVFRFVVELKAPAFGDVEILVDATNGSSLGLRALTRK